MTEENSISFEIQKELPVLPWTRYPANAFNRAVCAEMLTDEGFRTIDTIGSRNARTLLSERLRAIYVFDASFIIASINRLFTRLNCDADTFMTLCRKACGQEKEAVNPVDMNENLYKDGSVPPIVALLAFKEYLSEFRAALPKPNDKGEYPVRYTKAVLLLEKLENVFQFDCTGIDFHSIEKAHISLESVKAKLARL